MPARVGPVDTSPSGTSVAGFKACVTQDLARTPRDEPGDGQQAHPSGAAAVALGTSSTPMPLHRAKRDFLRRVQSVAPVPRRPLRPHSGRAFRRPPMPPSPRLWGALAPRRAQAKRAAAPAGGVALLHRLHLPTRGARYDWRCWRDRNGTEPNAPDIW